MTDFLLRELHQKLPGVITKHLAMLWGVTGEIIPATPNATLSPFTRLLKEYNESAGHAALYTEGAMDIPLVSTRTAEDDYKAFAATLGLEWSMMELAEAQRIGRDIVGQRLEAVRRGLDERCHKLAVFGDTNHTGLLNSSLVPVINPALDLDNAATTAYDLIDFFSDIFETVEDQTNRVDFVDTLLVPPKILNLMKTKILSNTDRTVLSHILDNYGPPAGTVRRIIAKPELAAGQLEANGVKAPGTNKDMIVAFSANPDAMGMQFKGFTPFNLVSNSTGTGWSQAYYRAQSEVMFHYPDNALYVNVDTVP